MQYNTIKIGSYWLSRSGSSVSASNPACKTAVEGLDAAQSDYTGVIQTALDGTPYAQIRNNDGAGLAFSITADYMTNTVLDNIRSAVETAFSGGSTIRVTISGGNAGTLDVNCIPALPDPIEYSGEYHGSIVRSVKFNFIISSRYA